MTLPFAVPRTRCARYAARTAASTIALFGAGLLVVSAAPAQAAVAVPLGAARQYSVLAGTTVTNTGTTTVDANVGMELGTEVADAGDLFVGGVTHTADAQSLQAQTDLDTAYRDAASQGPITNVDAELGGTTLAGGVYRSDALKLAGEFTLDGANDPESVWVLQATTLRTIADSAVRFINGANPCNVFWQIDNAVGIGERTDFVGTIMASDRIVMQNGATLRGRALSLNAAVTLDSNVITSLDCERAPNSTTTTTPTTPTTEPTGPTGPSEPSEPSGPTPTTSSAGSGPTEPGQTGRNCDPSYPDVCIKPAPPDLDCPDVSFTDITVIGDDPHGFDDNNDGVGCESGAPNTPQIPNTPVGSVPTGSGSPTAAEQGPVVLAEALGLAGIAGFLGMVVVASRRRLRG